MVDNPPVTNAPGDYIKTIGADGATRWIGDGWRIFTAAPGMWIGISLVAIVIHLLLSIVPVIGGMASAVLAPVFAGGLMAGCAAVQRNEPLQFDSLFLGFRQNTSQLMTVGALYLAGVIGIMIVLFMIGGGTFAGAMMHGNSDIAFNAGLAVGGALLIALVALLLFTPLIMAIWFAPALVMLRDVAPAEAMKMSFVACLRNWLVFTVYSVLVLLLMILATIPLGLGWLILIPLLIGSVYASFQDIF